MDMFKVNDRAMIMFYMDELEKEMKFIKLSPTHEPVQDHLKKAHISLQNFVYDNIDNMLADDYRRNEAVDKIHKLMEKLVDIEDAYIPKIIIKSEF